MFLVRLLKALLKGRPKTGYSIRGFWGETKHFNRNGIQIGYTIKGFWGQRKRFDMNGNLISVTWKNFWGGYNTYDAEGNLIRRSRKNFWGGYNTYDRFDKKIWESHRNFWNGMNHFDLENPESEETFIVEKRKPLKSNKQSSVLAVSQERRAETKENPVEGKTAADKNVEEKNVESKTVNTVIYEKREQEKGVRYYSGIKERVNDRKIGQYIRLLVFQYKQFAEFPAIAYSITGDMVRVEPLQMEAEPFEFHVSEIETAQEEMVTELDMSVITDEFLLCTMAGAGREFEDLLPEYPFGESGVYRKQYVLDCGMVVTEKSMEELRKLKVKKFRFSATG